MGNEMSLSEQIADKQHLVRVNNQLLEAIKIALEERTGRDRQRLERQRGLLTRERDQAAQELSELEQFVESGGLISGLSRMSSAEAAGRK